MTPEQRDELLALLDGSMPIAAAWNVVESLSRMKASARFRFASALQGTVRRSYHPRGRRPTATQGELLQIGRASCRERVSSPV